MECRRDHLVSERSAVFSTDQEHWDDALSKKSTSAQGGEKKEREGTHSAHASLTPSWK